MRKAKKTPEDVLEEYVAELQKDFDRWEEILEHGSGDPFWPDGTGLQLKRSHILHNRDRIRELCEENGMELPEIMKRGVPPAMPQHYMVVGGEYFAERYDRLNKSFCLYLSTDCLQLCLF